MEADISKAEARIEKAEAEGNAEDLRWWRIEKTQLRDKEHQLRNEQLFILKARSEVQQQGNATLCSPLNDV